VSETPQSIDLRTLLSNFGGSVMPGVSASDDRSTPEKDVVMTDTSSLEVTAEAGDVTCFIDGIQSSVTLAWRESRPVSLQYAGAGAQKNGHLLGAREEMVLVCADDDADWVRANAPEGLEVVCVEGETPYEVTTNVANMLPGMRERMERELCDEMLRTTTDGLIVCDGSIVGRTKDDRIVGVVKTTRSRYLSDESVLWKLPRGWRSPRFVIPAGVAGPNERHSCYVRLHDARRMPWDFALIRLEAFQPEILENLAAMVLEDAQDGSRVDARWDRHLRSVRACEDLMRSRRPSIF
jgi:hypothetical protein